MLPEGLYPFALAWDGHSKRLWVAADCPPGVSAIKACDRGALIGLSAFGKIAARLAPEGGIFHPGDVSAGPDGVFVSDSQNGAVFRLAQARPDLAMVLGPTKGGSAQGTALAAGGRTLLVADYSQGLGILDIATGVRKILAQADGKPVRGVDGLVRCGETYFGVYNGGAIPARVYQIQTGAGDIERSDLISEPAIADPTQIAFDGKRLLVVSDSGWERIGKNETARSKGAHIIAIPLSATCRPI